MAAGARLVEAVGFGDGLEQSADLAFVRLVAGGATGPGGEGRVA